MKRKPGCVYLVGAGCADADLITVRGLRLLQNCDAVVYDDLIDSKLLAAASLQAERIYMGKRRGKHSASQAEINEMLICLAQAGKNVVRLKGGDPFVFGRGGEELLALRFAGIPCEEVPGISSAIAIPAAAGIPVTHRGLSQSLHIITGHTADEADALPNNLHKLAKLSGTLVILMGLASIERIAAKLLEGGMLPETPAAVLSGGNSSHPAQVFGTLSTIAEQTRQANMTPPAVIVVGKTAAMGLSSTISKPLAGVRIGLTGTRIMLDKLIPPLQTLGAVTRCVVEMQLYERKPDLQNVCDGRPRWLVFTSANGIHVFFSCLSEQGIDLRRLSACRFAVIGTATCAALLRYGIHADLCPLEATSAMLAQQLCAQVPPTQELWLLRSSQGAAILPQVLYRAGFSFREVSLYDPVAGALAETDNLDYLVFCSSGGVELFFQSHGTFPPKTIGVCIGKATAETLRRMSDCPILQSEASSADGILKAIVQHHTTIGKKTFGE